MLTTTPKRNPASARLIDTAFGEDFSLQRSLPDGATIGAQPSTVSSLHWRNR